ncbi:hypothetical protein [Phascolarctobacterium faecium]|uniref:hypothetical protein n=2 Tax=Phascolarctobacterium faecium TaxID=33025 RepID=UPI003AB7D2E8
MSFLSVLGLIFIVLKLLGVITWSWWIVLAPLYFGLVLTILLFLGVTGWVFLKGDKQ